MRPKNVTRIIIACIAILLTAWAIKTGLGELRQFQFNAVQTVRNLLGSLAGIDD